MWQFPVLFIIQSDAKDNMLYNMNGKVVEGSLTLNWNLPRQREEVPNQQVMVS